jgi:uncharacterized protein
MEKSAAPTPISAQDEHILAAIAHAGIIFPMWGLIAPVLIWITQREKSRFVAFHALQAAIYQFLMVLAWFAGGACYMGSFFLTFAGVFSFTGRTGPESPVIGALFFLPFVLVFLIAIASLAAVVLGVAAAVLTFQGKDFRYPLVARWAERYQQNNPVS